MQFHIAAIATALLGANSQAVLAADPPLSGPSDNTANLEQVIVTGTRQKRSASKSTAPIDVINAADLQKTGAGSLTAALNEILPSFNLPTVTGYDQSAIVRPANLRGLNGDQTLVLVNGKRRHVSAVVNVNAYVNRGSEPVDLDMIPFSAIDHIEVLRDGAAAQYGSDAIAGVINIILKSNHDGIDASAQTGIFDFKDGFTNQGGYEQGFRIGSDGFFDLSLAMFSQNPTDRAGAAEGPFYYPLPIGCMGNACSPDPREATTDPHKVKDGLPYTRSASVSYNAGTPLTTGIDFYSFSTYSYRHSKGYEFWRYANDGNADPTYNYNPSTGTFTQLYPDGYEPKEVIDENDFSVTAGVKGKDLYSWAWDLATTYGSDDASVGVIDTMNPTLGPGSPTSFYAGSWVNSELTGNFDVTRPFEIGLAGPLNVALGVEYRNNAFALKPGEPSSYEAGPYTTVDGIPTDENQTGVYSPPPGAQAFPGFNPIIAGHEYRDSGAAYVDFETKPIQRLDVGVAGRYEHYDDFGSTTTGKLSLRYEFSKDFAVRGTVSNGFRAPSLGQSLYAATTTNFANGAAFQVGTFPVASLQATTLGATPLRPEKSTNYSVGFVATPVKSLDVTVDVYRIYVRHRIMVTSAIGANDFNDTASQDYIAGLLTAANLDPGTSVQYFTNAASTRTQGLDLVSSYKSNFHEYGNVRWSVEGNLNQTSITDLGQVPTVLQPVLANNPGFNIIGADSQGFLTLGTPRNKLILGAQYNKENFHANLRETRYGHIVDTSVVIYGGPKQYVPARWLTDLELSYDFTPAVTVALGANNLFDQYPPQTTALFQSNVGDGVGHYDPLTPGGYFGGFYYGRLEYHFGR